jgi:hypothetical protein
MQPQTANTQPSNQFERSPEPFPKTIIFPEAWDLSEILNGDARPVIPSKPETTSGLMNAAAAKPV